MDDIKILPTQLHPDGDDSIVLHPETDPTQIVGLNEYLQNESGIVISITGAIITEVNDDA